MSRNLNKDIKQSLLVKMLIVLSYTVILKETCSLGYQMFYEQTRSPIKKVSKFFFLNIALLNIVETKSYPSSFKWPATFCYEKQKVCGGDAVRRVIPKPWCHKSGRIASSFGRGENMMRSAVEKYPISANFSFSFNIFISCKHVNATNM